MLVRCLVDDIRDPSLGEEARSALGTRLGIGTTRFALSKGRVYVVYAVSVEDGGADYFVLDADAGSSFPIANSSVLFEVLDARVSRHWLMVPNHAQPGSVLLAPPLWASHPLFYEQLVDGVPEAVNEFQVWKDRLDSEFPHPSHMEALDLGQNWVQCVHCDAAWEIATSDGTLLCQDCRAYLRNPLHSI